MRWIGLLAAVAALWAQPAAAKVYSLVISGTLTGTLLTQRCNSGSPSECLASGPSLTFDPYENDSSRLISPVVLDEGDNQFDFGFIRGAGAFSGIIANNNGYLTGRDLRFAFEDPGFRFSQIGSTAITASAATFNVIGGVPEPGTWTMLLLGFGFVGGAMRSLKRRQKVIVSYT
jgi:hypothetical protein